MKAFRIARYEGPSGLELVEESDLPAPVGREVVVRIRAASINFRDLMDINGALMPPGSLPARRIPGCDGAGEVLAVGPSVTRVKRGDRVALTYHRGWMGGPVPRNLDSLGRGVAQNDGTITQQTCVDESELVHIPAHLSFEEAATLPCAGVTAWWSLFGPAFLLPGEFLLLQGTGGVSMFALQFARIIGARVIATTTSPHKAKMLRDHGAEFVIDTPQGKNWVPEVIEATGGLGVDWAINIAAGSTFDPFVQAVRHGGRLIMVGWREGDIPGVDGSFMMRGLNIHSTRVGSRDNFEDMNRAIAGSGMKPVVSRIFGFDEVPAAFASFAEARHVGKVAIHID
jgi:NADPH:quinone reductase-like Zn-dependent oxidoreductase